jgi:hypothetical protein
MKVLRSESAGVQVYKVKHLTSDYVAGRAAVRSKHSENT